MKVLVLNRNFEIIESCCKCIMGLSQRDLWTWFCYANLFNSNSGTHYMSVWLSGKNGIFANSASFLRELRDRFLC